MHVRDQPWYCNQVVLGLTAAGPHRLVRALQAVEEKGGRYRATEYRFGPRSLDLDLLVYGDYLISAADLVVPHPRMHLRSFVIDPLLEVAPHARDPRNGRPWAFYRQVWTR